jgi:hypothetical protein
VSFVWGAGDLDVHNGAKPVRQLMYSSVVVQLTCPWKERRALVKQWNLLD